jgi:exonuclease SbcD
MQQNYLEQVTKEIETFTREGRKDADVCILTGHFSIQGVVAGSERNWTIDEEYALPPALFDTELFDYIAMGHVHRHQTIKARTPIIYPGSIERVDLAEAEEDKGFVQVDIRDRSVSWKYIKLTTRTMQNLQIACKEEEDPILAVNTAIATHPVEDAIVNLQITSPNQITPLQKGEINRLLKDAFWSQVHYVRLQTGKEPAEGTFARTLEPMQALNEYLNSLKIPEAKRNEAMKIGQQIIEETIAKAEA